MTSNLIQSSILAITLLFFLNAHAAITIVECEDESGNRSFQKKCPPGSTTIDEKKLSTGAASSDEDTANNTSNSFTTIRATLYRVPECGACDEVKEFFNTRNISVTEKNVKEDIALQEELSTLAGGLTVPTTVIGKEVLSGYNRSQFLSTLEAAGYTE